MIEREEQETFDDEEDESFEASVNPSIEETLESEAQARLDAEEPVGQDAPEPQDVEVMGDDAPDPEDWAAVEEVPVLPPEARTEPPAPFVEAPVPVVAPAPRPEPVMNVEPPKVVDPKIEDFVAPPSKIPAPEPASTETPDWATTVPGSPEFPVETNNGMAAGGLIKFTLCPNCHHYRGGRDQCVGPAPESWRAEATACINFRLKNG